MSNTLNADLLRGLYDTLPPNERNSFLAALPGATDTRPPPKLLTVQDVADRFGCTARTVRNWIATGEVTAIKRGRLIRVAEDSLYSMNQKGE